MLLSFFLLFFYSEPNAPPFNVHGRNTSSTTILVQWGDVPSAAQNGIILHYTVTYTSLPGGNTRTKVVNSPTTKAILTGLNKYTNYSITVFASTSKGDGNVSGPIVVVTDESSKFIFVLKYSVYHIFNTYLSDACKQLIYKVRPIKGVEDNPLLQSSRKAPKIDRKRKRTIVFHSDNPL